MIRNKVILIGRLTRDVELKKTSSDVSFVNFSLAVDKPRKKDADHPEAIFVNCNAWRGTADFISKYFAKGSKLAVEGYLDDNNWTDKDGNEHKDKVVVVDTAEFVERKSGKTSENNQAATTQQGTPADDQEDDSDLPF